jgi:hypothetical protein
LERKIYIKVKSSYLSQNMGQIMPLSKKVMTTGIAGGLISPIRALLLAPLKGDCHFRVLSCKE